MSPRSVLFAWTISLAAVAAVVARGQDVDFVRDVRPIFGRHCYSCHGPDKQKSGLRLDVKASALNHGDLYAPGVRPGSAAESPLWKFVAVDDADLRMPPEGERLSAEEIETLRKWIDEGAQWPDGVDTAQIVDKSKHWSFQPIVRSLPLEADSSASVIDGFVEARLREAGLRPNPPADRRTWLRRVFLTMTGLPPTPEQIAAFVADDRPTAREEIVDQLLASPRFGERFGQLWLDTVRYADTHGCEVNTPRDNAWPYRDYVIDAFNADKPYDRFVIEQIAGDTQGADAATGFMVTAAALLPGQIGADEESMRAARQDALDEVIVNVGASLLGLTIGCARCHDHKFDPIAQRDYYSLQAFFAGTEYGDRPIVDAEFLTRRESAKTLIPYIDALQAELQSAEPIAFAGRTIVIDEEDKSRVEYLKPANGPGQNPPGPERGHKGDVGDATRLGNISQGRYTWWNNTPGEDVLTYRPGVAGQFRLWLSWGAHGSGVHTRDARYVLDRDGELSTHDDQREIAVIDQYFLAGVSTGETPQTPLWSGLLDAGIVEIDERAKLVLRGGDTGTGITADVIVLQEVSHDASQSQPAFREPIDPRQNTERFVSKRAKYVRFTSQETVDSDRHEPCLDELEIYGPSEPKRNLARDDQGAIATSSGNYSNVGIHQLPHIFDGRYGNSWSWISSERGRGWVQIELAAPTEIDRVVWGRDREGRFTDRLPIRYQIDVSLDGSAWTTVATHADRLPRGTPFDRTTLALARLPAEEVAAANVRLNELRRLEQERTRLESPRMTFGGVFRAPDKTFVLRRGDPEQPTTQVSAAPPAFLSGPNLDAEAPESDRRRALADWLVAPGNPLPARVIVNRVWQHYFGVGLVETPNDFGLNGARPSHPELLDSLASEFVAGGWSLKRLHREIALSATFARSSTIEPQAAASDRDNRLLWRYAPRRLEAESIRDAMLAVSGELNLQAGGPGFNLFQSRGGLNGFPPVESFGPNELRRLIYQHKVRMEPAPVFGAFDCPDAGQSAPKRTQSTTAIQALSLFNSSFTIDRAAALAARAERETNNPGDRVGRVFLLALGREPSPSERALGEEVVARSGLVPLCRALFNSNEFLFLP